MGCATFTAAQWKELERQAMIYKYMVASVPIPYQLLLPIIQNTTTSTTTTTASPFPSPFVRYSSTKQDLEPGRCKRTDGKKWRCSRDVAPNQKYCERHMHRGRPRSRKHVELCKNPTNPNPNPNPSSSSISTCITTTTSSLLVAKNNNPPPPSAKVIQPPFFLLDNIMQSNQRDWSTEGEEEWREIMQTSRSIFNNNNNNDFGEEYYHHHHQTPTIGDKDSSSSSCGGVIVSSSALDLSSTAIQALGNINPNGFNGQVSSSCGGGGPLAEVLGPSLISPCPYPTGNGDDRTTMLSPDGTSNNSPTTVAAAASSTSPTPDIVAFQWFT